MNEKKYLKEDLQKVGKYEYRVPEDLRDHPYFRGLTDTIKCADVEFVLELFRMAREVNIDT